MDRSQTIDRIASRTEPWDILVIGGGATGAGCALDAASRGFDVLLLEQHDFGKGTSSRSTKLVHGGVRYLAQGNLSLVREALRERGRLLVNAPHVVHKLRFVLPCYSHWQKLYYGFGLKVYDLLAGRYSFGRSKMISPEQTIAALPTIETSGLRGGILYYDGQFDDARLLIDILRTADTHGAAVVNYARVNSLRKNDSGQIDGVVADIDGYRMEFSGKVVINATGAFCEPVRRMSDPASVPIVTFSQGVHLVFDRQFLPTDNALIIPETSDGRVLFCIPWNEHLLVGTTDTRVDSAMLEPHALEQEIDFILETAGSYLSAKPTRTDVLSVYAGIRPLITKQSNLRTSSLPRGHDLLVDNSGLVTITGGKWTTYRKMAEDTVDRAVAVAKLEKRECKTHDLPIEPAGTFAGERLRPELPYTRDDVIRAVRDEMAVTLEDVLARRTRALFLNARSAIEVAPEVVEIMSEELGRDADWREDQLSEFNRLASKYLVHET